jgi:hypothetical protein
MTPLQRLVQDVLDNNPDLNESKVAKHAGLHRSTLNSALKRLSLPEATTRHALRSALGVAQWRIDEAAAQQAGLDIRPRTAGMSQDLDRLLAVVDALVDGQRERWFRLARRIAEELAAEASAEQPDVVDISGFDPFGQSAALGPGGGEEDLTRIADEEEARIRRREAKRNSSN